MKSKKKLLLVCDKNPCTSFGRLTLDTKKALISDFDVKIVWLTTPQYFSDFSVNEKEDFFINAFSLYTGFFSFRKSLRKILSSFQPDFIFFIRPELGFLVPLVKKELPLSKIVLEIHDTFAETLYPKSVKFKLINYFFIKNTICADAFIFNSNYTREEALAYFNIADKPSCVLGCPINYDLFNKPERSPSQEEKQSFREKNNIHGFNGFCLNISLDEPRKNLETFFELARLTPETAFVRIGKKTERIQNMIQQKQLKNAFLFSEIKAELLRDFYRNADLLIYPSFLEGFGLPPLEALACGTPVLASSTSALKENLDGITPLVYPPNNVESYAKLIKQQFEGKCLVDWNKAELLLERFSLKKISERLINFLQTLL